MHLSELGTTAASGIAHWRLGNVDRNLVLRLGLPGAIGAFAGATILSSLPADVAKPVVGVILLALGLKAIFLVTTLLGMTGLWLAVMADTGATVLVTANALRLLRRHTGPISFAPTWRALARFAVAAVPAFIAGFGVFLLTGAASGWTSDGRIGGFLGAVLVGGTSLVVYVGALALLRAPEVKIATGAVRRILRR